MIASRLNTSDTYNGCLSFLKYQLTSVLAPGKKWKEDKDITAIVGSSTPNDTYPTPYQTSPTYIEIYFGKKFIVPVAYMLMGRRMSGFTHYLRSWQFYGKTISDKWVLLHFEENKEFSFAQIRIYPINKRIPFKGFMINMTSKDSKGYWALCLGQIDVFGKIYSSLLTIKVTKWSSLPFILLIIIVK